MTDPQPPREHAPPAEATRPFIFRDLMAKVGNFLLYWSSLEIQLTKGIADARARNGLPVIIIRGPLSERLDDWHRLVTTLPENKGLDETADRVMVQVLEMRNIRNLIVHGLSGGDAMPKQGRPYIACDVGGYDNPTGQMTNYTIDELEHFNEGIDACRRAFIRLEHFSYRTNTPPPFVAQPLR